MEDFRSLVLYVLYLRHEDEWQALLQDAEESPAASLGASFYSRFADDAGRLMAPLAELHPDPAHLFAIGFQVRCAFHHIFRKIFGAALPIVRLRATIWESLFTHSPALYRDSLFAVAAALRSYDLRSTPPLAACASADSARFRSCTALLRPQLYEALMFIHVVAGLSPPRRIAIGNAG